MARSNSASAPQIAIDFGITVSNDNIVQGLEHLSATGQLPKKQKAIKKPPKGSSNANQDIIKQQDNTIKKEIDDTKGPSNGDAGNTNQDRPNHQEHTKNTPRSH